MSAYLVYKDTLRNTALYLKRINHPYGSVSLKNKELDNYIYTLCKEFKRGYPNPNLNLEIVSDNDPRYLHSLGKQPKLYKYDRKTDSFVTSASAEKLISCSIDELPPMLVGFVNTDRCLESLNLATGNQPGA